METITRDKQVRGLHLREFKCSKAFYLDFTIEGKRKKVKIGEMSDCLGWNEARLKAIQIRNEPPEEAKPKTLTISDVFSLWSADIGLQKKSRKFDLRMFEGVLKPHFQDQDLTHIKYSDLRELHTQLTTDNGPYRANRVLQLLRTLFNYLESIGQLNPNPFPKKFRLNKEHKRKRYLSKEELSRLTKVLNQEAPFKPKQTTLVWLLLFTGARIGELLNAKWSDLDGNVLRLKNHKTDYKGEERNIFLSHQAMQLINNLSREGEKIIGFNTAPQKWWMRVRKQAGLEDLRFHDLRHSFASFMVSNGSTLEEIGSLLGHSEITTTKRYAHLMSDKNQENAQKTSDNITKIIMGVSQ